MTEDELTLLFRQHYSAVLSYGLRRVDATTAQEVAAETFVVAWRRLRVPPQEPRSWLLAVARRVLANELRRSARADRLGHRVADEASVGRVLTVEADPATSVTEVERVRAALSGLGARDQEVLRLVAWDGLDQSAAAQVLGCSTTALKVQLHRARRRLEAALVQDDHPAAQAARPVMKQEEAR